jgi:hypothetical protein
MLKMMRRKVPWLLVFEAVMALRRHWKTLPPHDRNRLATLVRRSHGNPLALTKQERAEFREIASRIDVTRIATDLAPFGRRLRGGR